MQSIDIDINVNMFQLMVVASYWDQHSEYTPESRIETHETMKKKRERESNE
jgi:hypothetical protein